MNNNNFGIINNQFSFLKNTDKVENSFDLLILKPELNYNESKTSIRNASCQICLNIAINPKMCEECEVLYCGNCSSNLYLNSKSENLIICRNCPEPLNLKPLSKSLQRALDDFPLNCPSGNEKCNEPILYKDLIEHLDECKYWVEFSKCLGCGIIDKMQVIEDHISTCPFTYYKCEICSNICKRKDIEIHKELCKKPVLNCEMCKTLKTRIDSLEDKLINKINTLESVIDFQQKSN